MSVTMALARPAVHPAHPFYLDQTGQALSCLPPLEDIFATRSTAGASDIIRALDQREQVLGAATLSGTGLHLLFEIATAHLQALQPLRHISAWSRRPFHERVIRHVTSHSAAETQALLPAGAVVQKTVSVDMDGKLLLCTGIGNQFLQRQHLHTVAAALKLPRRAVRHCTINPSTCDAISAFEMVPGMVSPFLRPGRATNLAALVLRPYSTLEQEQEKEVAISLSLWESLLLPLRCLEEVVRCYARQAYPSVRIIELPREVHPDDQ